MCVFMCVYVCLCVYVYGFVYVCGCVGCGVWDRVNVGDCVLPSKGWLFFLF